MFSSLLLFRSACSSLVNGIRVFNRLITPWIIFLGPSSRPSSIMSSLVSKMSEWSSIFAAVRNKTAAIHFTYLFNYISTFLHSSTPETILTKFGILIGGFSIGWEQRVWYRQVNCMHSFAFDSEQYRVFQLVSNKCGCDLGILVKTIGLWTVMYKWERQMPCYASTFAITYLS